MRRLLLSTGIAVLAAAAGLLWADGAAAQAVTTSAISGTVTDDAGQPIAGAQIVVVNEATGTQQGVITRSDGRFNLPGLRPGGPYRIEARSIGYTSVAEEGVELALGQTEQFSFTLGEEAVAVEGFEVVGERSAVISRSRTGTGSTISESRITRSPTITRDFTDFTRLTPQLTTSTPGTSAAGRNNRFNNIQIDGATNNDLFGLAASGTPGGQANARPITLEAIQEFQVVLAPFDVRQGGFTGAGINAVTRGGTNDFQGAISYYGRNQDFVGNFVGFDGQESVPVDDFDRNDLAFRFGGPIVRDRAHFFVAGEMSRQQDPLNAVLGQNVRVAQDDIVQVRDYLVNEFGFDPGEFGPTSVSTDSDNVFARLDVALSDAHRLTLRHNYVDADQDNIDRGTTGFGFSRSGHTFESTTNSTVAQLNSSFGSGTFNELRLGLTTVRDQRNTGQDFPRVRVDTPDRGLGGPGFILAGPNEFSGRNALDQDVLEVTNDFSFTVGDHNITLGTNNEFFRFSNLFVRNPFGQYRFDSFDDLQAGNAYYFENSFLLSGGDERAEFPARRLGIYAQDQWSVFDNLVLTLGLRYDLPQLPRAPKRNEEFEAAVAPLGIDRRTDERPHNNGQFNPRVGFNWDVRGDQGTQLRGGTGLFSGRTPFVWISNAYGNTGMDFVRFTCTTRGGNPTGTPQFNPDPAGQPTECQPGSEASLVPNEVNLADPEFRFPQVWRTSAAIDQRLPGGFIATLEGLFTQTVSDVLYQNLLVERDPSGRIVEGRPLYNRRQIDEYADIIDITNTSEGYGYNVTAQVQRPFRNGWDLSAAYTYSDAYDVNRSGSSQAISNWRFNLNQGDPNNPELARSNFVIQHRIVASGSYRANFLERFPTDISLIYIGESGQPYSYVYSGDVGGDGQFSNDLVYVPRSPSEINFEPATDNDGNVTISPEQSWQNLDDFIGRVPCLDDARGTVIERGACQSPWSSRFDLRIAQNINTFGSQNAQITLDVLNVGNLINSSWGRQEFISFDSDTLLGLARGSEPDNEGHHTYDAFAPRANVYNISNIGSRYQLQLGLRYSF